MGYVIAIDGPAGAGKSTIARRLAERLGYTFVDSGAMYRAVALWALREDTDLDDAHRLEQLAGAAEIELLPLSRVRLNDEDVSDAIRTADVSIAASRVAAVGAVRAALVAKQKQIADFANVVMEGRDIGTVVFPDARVKIFLDADPAERVRRRAGEQPDIPAEQIADQLAERDERDRQRAESPLVQAPDAVYLDSTGMTLEQVEEEILKLVRARISNGKDSGIAKSPGHEVRRHQRRLRRSHACCLRSDRRRSRPQTCSGSCFRDVEDHRSSARCHQARRIRRSGRPRLRSPSARTQALHCGRGVDPGLVEGRTRRRADSGKSSPISVASSTAFKCWAIARRARSMRPSPPGERLSALLVSEHLKSRGIAARAVNAAEVIITDAVFNNASPLMDATEAKANARLAPLLNAGEIPVVTGFNGATADGRPTTLGRGGSDFSASILAAVLGAGELWIWTDVDGIMTADPRVVPDAKILAEITYSEAAELAYAGARVLHPRTLAPLVERGIPVWSKNSFAPSKPGTRIVPALGAGNAGARAVTSMANVTLISLEPARTGVGGVHIMARALDALDRANVEVLAISGSSYRQSVCFLVRNEELENAMEAVEAALALELAHGYVRAIDVDREVGLLAVVGEGMRGFSGVAGRIFTAISRENVNIIAIAQGSSELTIAIVVRRDGLEKAVRAVHAECHL